MKIRIFDRCSGYTGYSRNISGIAMALLDLGVDVKIIQQPTDEYIPDKLKPHMIFDFNKGVQEIDKDTIVWGRTFAGIEGMRAYNPKAIATILVLEGDRIPESWTARANMCDIVFASSEYNREMLIKNGVACDIVVIHHGFDQNTYYSKWDQDTGVSRQLYRYGAGEHPQMGMVRDGEERGVTARLPACNPFTFGFIGGHTNPIDRKGGQWVAEAFNVFSKEDNVKLVFKINKSYNPNFDSEGHLRSLIREDLQDKVEFNNDYMTDKELADFYRSLDVSVTPSAGEAFCMSIAEALACGTPCIVTDWSGYLDYTKPSAGCWHIPIKKRFLAHYGMFDPSCGSVWVMPDIEKLKEAMKACYVFPEITKEMGQKAAEYMHKEGTWEKQAQKTIEAINDFINKGGE